MSRVLRSAATAVAILALAIAARGQGAAPEPPTGAARIDVTLVHEDGPASVAGAEVILYSLSPSGDPGLRRGRADAQGRVVFEALSNDPDVVYLVGTRVAGVPFGTRFAFERDELARVIEVEVSDPDPSAGAVEIGETRLRLEPGCADLRVHHTHALQNRSERVIYVAPELREGATPLLELELPEGASPIETPLGAGREGFDRSGRTLRFWGPLYAGVQEIEFGYGLPLAPRMTLELGFPAGSGALSVFTPSEGLDASGDALRADGEMPLPSGPHRVQRSEPLAPGTRLALTVAAEQLGRPAGLRLAESRLWLELDDAALDVSEQHQLSNAGEEVAHSPTGAPLFCLPLPPQARDVRFGSPSPELGMTRDTSGALAVHGPLPAGETTLSVRYRLPSDDATHRFERAFATDVELLSVLVADTGIVPHSARLHPRRPIRTEDRAYLHLEAFAIEPDEVVELSLERLPRSQGIPRVASVGFVLAVAFASMFFLVAPLRRAEASEEALAPEPAQAIERQALYQAIEALDEDYETGKLSEADHARMREELRTRAVQLLQSERAAASQSAAPAAPARTSQETPAAAADAAAALACAACSAPARKGDRFCSRCGAALGCPSCGAPLRAGDRFCSQCGRAVTASASAPEPPPR